MPTKNPENISLKAKAEKYAKITAKTIISSSGEDSASYGQNAFFYDAAEALLTSVILLIAEYCPPEKRHIISVFKMIQDLMAPSPVKNKSQFQLLMDKLSPDHKARWCGSCPQHRRPSNGLGAVHGYVFLYAVKRGIISSGLIKSHTNLTNILLKGSKKMIIEKINTGSCEKALELVLSVFMRCEAPDYSEEGIQTFKNFINNKEAVARLEMYGAFINSEITGVIATRNRGSHITLFFVDEKYHSQGIGRKLFETIIKESKEEKITVNSSPYAVEVYKKLGFLPDSDEQVEDGIRFTPMTYMK